MKPHPSVAIIVLNWNGLADTLECLASLDQLDYSNFRTVVVDNGSSDDSPAVIRECFPQVKVIENEENLGFTGGNNLGFEWAQKESFNYALLLNNDTVVAPDFLSELMWAAEADPTIGIAGPTIYYYDDPQRIWTAGGIVDWQQGNSKLMSVGEVDTGQLGSTPRLVDFVTGCALLAKMEMVSEIGGLDPRFFAYYEETEWCVRAGRAGYRIVHVPAAKVWHKITPGAREASPQVHYYMTRNRLLFLKLAGVSLSVWLRTLLMEYARTWLSWTLKPKWRHKASQRRAMVKAIVDYRRGRFGKQVV